MLLRDGILLPTMNVGESVSVNVTLLIRRIPHEHLPAAQSITITFVFYEARDEEVNRIVPLDITLLRDESETGSPTTFVSHYDAHNFDDTLPNAYDYNRNSHHDDSTTEFTHIKNTNVMNN